MDVMMPGESKNLVAALKRFFRSSVGNYDHY